VSRVGTLVWDMERSASEVVDLLTEPERGYEV